MDTVVICLSKFTHKIKNWKERESSSKWHGPWEIKTPSHWGNKLKIKGTCEWNDQGWGYAKGECRLRVCHKQNGEWVEDPDSEIWPFGNAP